MLQKFISLWNTINNLGPTTKTLIIFIFSLLILFGGIKNYTDHTIQKYVQDTKEEKQLSEEYTKTITPIVNRYLKDIINQDKEVTNVILLNYHNTITSSNGLSYSYLTSIVEQKRGFDTRSCLRIWKELEYINYGVEFEKINSVRVLQMEDIDKYKQSLPNLVELLQISEAKSAAFYSLQGTDGAVGMLLVIYKTDKIYPKDYYQEIISPTLYPLTGLLDYNSNKDKYKQMQDKQYNVNDLLK